jgi:hypothetical protein
MEKLFFFRAENFTEVSSKSKTIKNKFHLQINKNSIKINKKIISKFIFFFKVKRNIKISKIKKKKKLKRITNFFK